MPLHVRAAESHERRVQRQVFEAGEITVETGTEFEQAGDPSVHFDNAGIRLGQTRHQGQQSAFTGAIRADNRHAFTVLHVKRHVFESMETLPMPSAQDRRTLSC